MQMVIAYNLPIPLSLSAPLPQCYNLRLSLHQARINAGVSTTQPVPMATFFDEMLKI